MNGFVLATMGKYEEAAAALERFKIIAPQDYPQVDEALWYLEGVYDKLYEITKEERWELEARIVAALQKKLKGPFSEEQYATAAHLYPRVLPGDADFYTAVIDYYAGKFSQALNRLTKLKNRGLMASHNRISADLLWVEASMYSGSKASDDVIEELLRISQKHSLTPLQKERAGFLLARYLMNEDDEFETNRVNHEGQTFVKSIIGKPWALNLTYKRGEIMRAKTPLRLRSKEDEEKSKRGPGRLIGELYANRSNDWIVSANLYLFSLPDLSLPGKGRIVGRENENEGWIFKDAQIDALKRRQQYLAVFEFDNSDSEKSIQGTLFTPK
jgi:tetratricopeptide (TPR) repeat protein